MHPRRATYFAVAAFLANVGHAFAQSPEDAATPTDSPPPADIPAPEPPPPEPAPAEAPPSDAPLVTAPPSSTPTVPPPSTVTPASTESDKPSGAAAWLGMPPMGSFQYATGVAELGLIVGNWPGTGGFGTGFHYTERGGALAGMLLALLGTAAEESAAQRRANETGRTQYYHAYSPDEFGKTGMTIDAFSSQLGGDVTGFNLDLYMVRRGNKSEELPWAFDWGINLHFLDGPDTTAMNASGGTDTDNHDTLGLGLLIGAMFPLSRWAQGEVRLRPVLPIGGLDHNAWLTAELGLVGNLGNRLYVRGSYNVSIKGDSGVMFGAGVRL